MKAAAIHLGVSRHGVVHAFSGAAAETWSLCRGRLWAEVTASTATTFADACHTELREPSRVPCERCMPLMDALRAREQQAQQGAGIVPHA